jgi:hypothetical protein
MDKVCPVCGYCPCCGRKRDDTLVTEAPITVTWQVCGKCGTWYKPGEQHVCPTTVSWYRLETDSVQHPCPTPETRWTWRYGTGTGISNVEHL